jgi:hypothetical protein
MADFEIPGIPDGFFDEPTNETQGGIEQIAANVQQTFPADQKKKPTGSSSVGGSSVSASNKKKSLTDLFVKDKSKEAEIRKRLGISEEDIAPKTATAVSTGISQKPAAKVPARTYKITKPAVETAMPSDRPTAETVEQTPFVMPKSVGPVNIPAPERETIAAESTGLVKQIPIKKYEHPVLSALSEDKVKEIEANQKEIASGYAVMNFDEKLGQVSFPGSNVGELLNRLTPRAFKSGGLGIMGSLLSLSGTALQLFDKTASSIGEGIFNLIGADEVTEALDYAETNKLSEPTATKKLFELGQISQKLSSAQMAKAEINSGISDKNVGKDPVGLLTSPLEGDMVDGFKKLGLSVVQQIPNLLAISATGSVILPSAILETGANLTEEYKEDKDISIADGIASTAKGIVAGFIENMFITDIKALRAAGSAIGEVSWTGAKQQLKKVFEEKGEDGVKDLISRSYGEALKKAFKGSGGESIEEILTEVSNFTIDTIKTGKFDSDKFSQSLDKAANAGLIGFATGGLISGPVMMASVEPLTFDQKRKVVEFNKIAADPTVSEEVRKTAQIQANKIIKENADKTSAKYDLLIAMDPKKRQEALAKMTEIRKMEADLEKIQDPELQKSVQEKLDKANGELEKMQTMQLFKEMQKKAAEAAANAPTAMQGAEQTQAPTAPLEVDNTQDQSAEPILEGKSEEQIKEIAQFDKSLKSIDPKAKLILVNSEEAFAKELEKFHSAQTARDMAKGSAGTFVSNQDGTNPTVIVNTNLADNSTYGHEVFHLAVTSLAGKNPAKFVEMQKKILGVLNKADSKKLTDFANAYDFSKLGEDTQAQRRAEEFLSELAGRLTSKDVRIQRTMLHDIANIIHDFIKAFNIKALNDLADKYLGKYAETEQLAKFFEGFATSMQKGKKIDVSYLDSKPIQLNETQKARLEGLTPGTEAYQEASRLNAIEPTPLPFDPQLNNESIVDSDRDVTRQQLKEGNLTDTPEFKKYQKTVKGLGPEDLWLARALFSEEARGNKLYAQGTKEQIIQNMQDELAEIKAAAENSSKYYLTTLYPDYIQKQIDKFTRENAVDLRTQWEIIRDSESSRKQFIDQTAAIQKSDLLSNLNYLIGNDTYSVPFQYAMVKDLIGSRYEIADAETQEVVRKSIKPSQYNTTERSFNTVQPDVVALTYNDYGNKLANAGEAYQYASLNKPKVDLEYSELKPYIFKESSTGEGTWLKFPQGNNPAAAEALYKIANTSHKYPAKWCTGGSVGTALSQLRDGDFYIFVDGKTGDARIAIRYNGSSKIAELRGLGDGQSITSADDSVLKEVVDTLPDGKSYAKDAKAQEVGKHLLDQLDPDLKYIVSTSPIGDFSKPVPEFEQGILALADKYDVETLLDILETPDRSYGNNNYLLQNIQAGVNNYIEKLSDKFGLGENAIYVAPFNGAREIGKFDPLKIKYHVGSLTVSGDETTFPELIKVSRGGIRLFTSNLINMPKLKSAQGINFSDSGKLVANELEGSIEISQDFGTNLDQEYYFEAKKLNEITFDEFVLPENSVLNIPSVKNLGKIKNWGGNAQLRIKDGKLIANNLESINASLYLNLKKSTLLDLAIIPNLKSVNELEIEGDVDSKENKVVDLPNVESIKYGIYAGGNINLNLPNLISNDDHQTVISITNNSKLNANKFAGTVLSIRAVDNSEINLNSVKMTDQIVLNKKSTLNANNLEQALKLVRLTDSSKLNADKVETIGKLEVELNSHLVLPSLNRVLDNTFINRGSSLKLPKAITLGLNDTETVKLVSESSLEAPNLLTIPGWLIIDEASKFSADKLTQIGGKIRIYDGSNIYLPELIKVKQIDVSSDGILNAPKLKEVGQRAGGIGLVNDINLNEGNEGQLIAPLLGYLDPNEPITRQQIIRLAPNGKPSNLDEKMYATVRTPEFKDWFGDWENDPENASKFVDENGEPQVVYHGTYDEFNEFDLDKKRFKVHDKGMFFTPELSAAKEYGDIQMPLFLNAKTLDYSKMDLNDSFRQLRAKENELLNTTTKEGVVLETSDKEGSNVKQFVVFDPNQAKSATGNVGTFSKESNDIRQQKANLWDGTRSARAKVEAKEKEKKDLNSLLVPKNIYKQMFERNANIAEALKEAGMAETFFMLYNKAGATPYATRKFAEAQLDIFGKLSKRERKDLDAVALLRRVIAVDTNFENRIADQKKNGLKEGEKALEMPKHPKFNDYGTGNEVDLNKDVAQEQLDKLKAHLGDEAFNKITDRSTKLFGAFSDILKYKYENGLINKETYDLYKDYDYIPRKFLFDIDLEDIPAGAFNTRGVTITKEELAKIGRGSDEFAEVDTEKMLKMAMIAAQHRVFTNRAIQNMAKELEGLTSEGKSLPWLKPANITQLKKGVDALEKDGSPKIEGADNGFRNMFYKKDGKRYAVQLKESYAKEFYDEELYDTNNVWYKLATNVLGAKITQTMAVGANPFFVLRNIPIDILSQVYYNNIYSGHGLGVTAQMAKGFGGTFEIMAKMAKASSKVGDNSEILNLIKEYGEAGGLMTTQTDDSTYLGKVGDVLGYLGNVSEVAAKLSAYRSVKGDLIKKFKKDNGTDPDADALKRIQLEAAYKARSAMDFNRGGLATKFGNGFLPFFNIQFQVAKISASYVKNNPVKFFNKISQSMGLVVGLTLLNMSRAGSDWENKDLKRDKETKLLFMNPFGKNADGTLSYMALQVPAPVKFFWNIAQNIAETIHYQMNGMTPAEPNPEKLAMFRNEFKKYLPNLKSSLMPPVFKAISEYLDNEDYFYGRKLSQDHLKNIFFSQEGAENENILTLYKTLFQGLEKNTGWGISPERFQKASEAVFTSPEYNALVSTMYTAAEWMGDKAYNGMFGEGIDPKLKSKYLTGDYSNAMKGFFKSGIGSMFKKTDANKNETLSDFEKEQQLKESIDYQNKRINTDRIQITRDIKRIVRKAQEDKIDLELEKQTFKNYIKGLESDDAKKYASSYVKMLVDKDRVSLRENIPTYLNILYNATSPEAQAIALKQAFGNAIYSDSMLRSDLKKIGFGNAVARKAKQLETETAPEQDNEPMPEMPQMPE